MRAKADAQAEALARNSQVINAMGMLQREHPALGPRAGARADRAGRRARPQLLDQRRHPSFSACVTQIAVLGWGAYLALEGKLTGGMMIAASIIAGRALQPLEGMIEGWRSIVQARAAYRA